VTAVKTLILGLGNPICADDGVGLRVASEVRRRFTHPEVDVAGSSAAGLEVLDLMSGYQRLIIIDAIQTPGRRLAEVHRLGLDDLPAPMHCSTIHNVDLVTALELGCRSGMIVPQEIVIFAVEVADVTTFSECCTPEVEKAIPGVADMVIQEIRSSI
jgi:hydrogenase maturation protease